MTDNPALTVEEEITMSINKPFTTVVGNLVGDPELRFTSNGAAVAKFRVLSTPRFQNRETKEWEDGTPFGIDCTVWREFAENVAESLHRGDRVVVCGELEQRQFEDREGNKRTAWDLQVDAVGPDLRYATTVVTKRKKADGGGARGDDEWAGASKTRPAAQAAPAGPPANAEEQRAAQAAQPTAAASPW